MRISDQTRTTIRNTAREIFSKHGNSIYKRESGVKQKNHVTV